ncbi:MAG TPA: hypothetical protein VNF73_01030, partial [Candidatus Saccharimonadales bacterium]|nr:hypothetical protein [Candidatus Saccharimonadales bacterium]
MLFHSILFAGPAAAAEIGELDAPDFFGDLHLDEIVASITKGRDEYDLAPFFRAPLGEVDAVAYRHEVFGDLEDPALLGYVRSFAEQMRAMRHDLARAAKVYYRYERERWFLDAANVYCDAVGTLTRDLTFAQSHSRGFLAFRDYLSMYVASPEFTALQRDSRRVKAGLDGITYRLHIRGLRVRVSRDESEPDYSTEVLETFQKFQQRAPKDYPLEFSSWPDMNHVEAAILDRVALLYPDVFASLDQFNGRHGGYLDKTIARFDREVQFYVAYLEYVGRFRAAGLAFCQPAVSDRSKDIHGDAVFDLALAELLVHERTAVVTNDFHLGGSERIFVVSGPNSGGKTTFARTIGQLHQLARVGCPVPGSSATLFLVDQIFAHFEREEDLQNLTGKLEDDLRRIHTILERATPNSLVILNETFGSTTLHDALFLNREVMEQIIERDL